LRQRLIDVWAGVEQSVIDDALEQWLNHSDRGAGSLNFKKETRIQA